MVSDAGFIQPFTVYMASDAGVMQACNVYEASVASVAFTECVATQYLLEFTRGLWP